MTAPAERHELRSIPSVDRVVRDLGEVDLPRPLVVAIVRHELSAVRAQVAQGRTAEVEQAINHVRQALERLRQRRIRAVINGTGVVLHTNLGRAPLAPAAHAALGEVAAQYSNLEYDLSAGTRGSRGAYVEQALALLCETDSATLVNNCAAALVLVLHHFVTPQRPEVLISRGELVQIGGGFRIPEILEASGATLREVGTTNRTTLEDYARAVGERTAMILKVHRSNFYMAGFVESPSTPSLAALAHRHDVPLVEDLGSGALFPTQSLGDEHEPTPAEVLREGVDLVTFSGDKLLGGPQAGIIAGRASHVAALKADPLFRALRCDKLVLSAMQATLDLYLRGDLEEVPTIAMMRASRDDLRTRAERLKTQLSPLPLRASIGESLSEIGGGSLPQTQLPSIALDLQPANGDVAELAARLRQGSPAVIGYVREGRFRLDLRTVFPHQDEALAAAITTAMRPDTAKGPGT